MKVAIVSTNNLKNTKLSATTTAELASKSILNLLSQTTMSKSEIDGLIVTSNSQEIYLSNIVSEMCGLKPKFSTRVENLCNSGTSGILMAFSLIQSGICKAVLVVGTEKQDSIGNKLNWDITRGIFDMPIHWAAMYASNHFHKFGTKAEDLALVSYKNHLNANKNPNAIFYDKIFSFTQILESDLVAEPLRKLDCCYPCDGASSVLLVSEDFAYRFELPVWIRSISQNNQGASFASISHSLDYIESTRIAAKEAFELASLNPKDIDIAEVHDAFTILELLAYEDIGFVKKGYGKNFITDKTISVNTRGGLLGCGHPIGATGISQTNEIVLQLQGLAKERQIGKLKTGLVHNMAAAGTSTTIILLQN